jgi:hypothetical protein
MVAGEQGGRSQQMIDALQVAQSPAAENDLMTIQSKALLDAIDVVGGRPR